MEFDLWTIIQAIGAFAITDKTVSGDLAKLSKKTRPLVAVLRALALNNFNK